MLLCLSGASDDVDDKDVISGGDDAHDTGGNEVDGDCVGGGDGSEQLLGWCGWVGRRCRSPQQKPMVLTLTWGK